MPVPNAEQTASIISLVLYFFLDHVIFLAYRLPHLPHEMLPPLADYDYAQHLQTRSFPVRKPNLLINLTRTASAYGRFLRSQAPPHIFRDYARLPR
jgi:hypothetical protein